MTLSLDTLLLLRQAFVEMGQRGLNLAAPVDQIELVVKAKRELDAAIEIAQRPIATDDQGTPIALGDDAQAHHA